MSLSNIIHHLTGAKRLSFAATNDNLPTLNEKIMNITETILYIFFFLTYVTTVDTYLPEAYKSKKTLKIIASTFLLLSLMTIIINIVDLFVKQ